jgi:3-phosphoshikimate 1-carboxyvinyltransferase
MHARTDSLAAIPLAIPPLTTASGTVRLPGSKSISNRVLLLAALSEGDTLIDGLLDADDTRVMRAALTQLGCVVREEPVAPAGVLGPTRATVGSRLRVSGLGGTLKVHEASLFLGNAGTAMRPLTAALAVLSTLQGGRFELHGVPRMHERPIGDLTDALRRWGCHITDLQQPGYPPLLIQGAAAPSGLAGKPTPLSGTLKVRGDVSSQFLTSLLLAAPLAAQHQDVVIEVDGELISKPYVEITLTLLAKFGVGVVREGWQRFTVPRGSGLRSPALIAVEGDASSASYFIALGALAAVHEPIRIDGVGAHSMQGDIAFVGAAKAMGASIEVQDDALVVRRGRWPLEAIDVDCTSIPDAAMTLAVMALHAKGTTRLRGIASWRVKETDRIAAMAAELRKLGASVQTTDDSLSITAPSSQGWRFASIKTYDDHRMAMCFSLAAFNPAGLGVDIEDPGCVAKTYPDYFKHFFALVHAQREHIPVITIDGPTASGKGTVASLTAERLGFHRLDSGALYRVAALAALDLGIDLDDAAALGRLASSLKLRFEGATPWLDGKDVGALLRREAVGVAASRISAHPEVRSALHQLQLNFRRAPGLVADGRDMGTVVFPDATLKVFLTATADQRASRRHKQLIDKGISANISTLREELQARDDRDKTRAASPLKPAGDAQLLDNSAQSIDESVGSVLGWWQGRGRKA